MFDPMSTSLGFKQLKETFVPTMARPGSLESRTFNEEDSTDWLISGCPHETVQFNIEILLLLLNDKSHQHNNLTIIKSSVSSSIWSAWSNSFNIQVVFSVV